MLIFTPAQEASYSASISVSSTRLFIFSHIDAGLPARAWFTSRRIRSSRIGRVVSGLKPSASISSGRA